MTQVEIHWRLNPDSGKETDFELLWKRSRFSSYTQTPVRMLEKASQQDAGILLTGARGNFTISWGPALDYYASLLKSGRWYRWFREMQQYSERTGMPFSRIAGQV